MWSVLHSMLQKRSKWLFYRYCSGYWHCTGSVYMLPLIHIDLRISLIFPEISRAPRSKKSNSRTQFLENFRTISGHFCRFHEAQDTENARFSVVINVIIIRTKANRHFYKHIYAGSVYIRQFNSNPSRGRPGGNAVSSPNGVWGRAPAEIELGAF